MNIYAGAEWCCWGWCTFERIRRITGYLVGTLDHFNNAKRTEVQDRVKHDVQKGVVK